LAVAAAENRRLEEMAARERQYAALATDPLIRLQMAGVNPGNFFRFLRVWRFVSNDARP